MGDSTNTKQNRLNLLGTAILVLGLALSGWLLQRGAGEVSEVASYEVVDGKVIAISPSDSKIYRAQLERFGGGFSILADEARVWFVGLWQGENLALMIALFSVLAGMSCFWKAAHLRNDDT